MTRSLVATGVLLIALGLAMFGMLAVSRHDRVPLIGEEQARVEPPPRIWTIGGALALAAGAACIGVGMNRWR